MLSELKERVLDVLKAVAPLIGVVCLLQVTLVQAPTLLFVQFLAGSALVTVGMLLLFIGIDIGILPMGRFIGAELPKERIGRADRCCRIRDRLCDHYCRT